MEMLVTKQPPEKKKKKSTVQAIKLDSRFTPFDYHCACPEMFLFFHKEKMLTTAPNDQTELGTIPQNSCNFYGAMAPGQSINSKRQKKRNFIFATVGTACSILRMSHRIETDASCPVLRGVKSSLPSLMRSDAGCGSSADGRSAVLLAERQRDEAIEFKPVRAAADSFFMVSESRQRNREKSAHSKHNLFWLQGLAYPHWSLGGIQTPDPPRALWSAQGALIFCQYLSLPSLPLAAWREGSFILQFGLIKFELS